MIFFLHWFCYSIDAMNNPEDKSDTILMWVCLALAMITAFGILYQVARPDAFANRVHHVR